jgi:hypothetical protein
MEAAEGQKFSAASRRAIEIVMVMNSQPTLHDSKPMLCRGILLLLNTKKYLRAQQIAPYILGAMQRKVHFCTQRNWKTAAWFTLCLLENYGIICGILTTEQAWLNSANARKRIWTLCLKRYARSCPMAAIMRAASSSPSN